MSPLDTSARDAESARIVLWHAALWGRGGGCLLSRLFRLPDRFAGHVMANTRRLRHAPFRGAGILRSRFGFAKPWTRIRIRGFLLPASALFAALPRRLLRGGAAFLLRHKFKLHPDAGALLRR